MTVSETTALTYRLNFHGLHRRVAQGWLPLQIYEFALALHFIKMKVAGMELPNQLPAGWEARGPGWLQGRRGDPSECVSGLFVVVRVSRECFGCFWSEEPGMLPP